MNTSASHISLIVAPGKSDRSVIDASGKVLIVPDGWDLLPPGDAGLTRRVKAAGPTWTVQIKKGRKIFSQGIWASALTIATKRSELEAERATESYAKKRASNSVRREKKQTQYVGAFEESVLQFLDFDTRYEAVVKQLAKLVTEHATPV
ncbi:MAG: DUF2293 domain-containing protein, partial [Pirellula sp.]